MRGGSSPDPLLLLGISLNEGKNFMSLYIILMGVQGAGKGEQARFIRETYQLPHVSTGDLFRAMKTRTDALAQRIQKTMAEGKLIDDDTTNEVVQERLSQADAHNGVILDGYPRTPAQAAWLDAHLANQGKRINAVLLLELDLYTAFKRSFGRVSSPDDTKSYNYYYNTGDLQWYWEAHPEKTFPPNLVAKNPASGEQMKRRPDDASADAIIKRIDTFMEQTAPLVDYYRSKQLLTKIYADQPIEVVSMAIKHAVDAAKK
jgi:adenylate kinase